MWTTFLFMSLFFNSHCAHFKVCCKYKSELAYRNKQNEMSSTGNCIKIYYFSLDLKLFYGNEQTEWKLCEIIQNKNIKFPMRV